MIPHSQTHIYIERTNMERTEFNAQVQLSKINKN